MHVGIANLQWRVKRYRHSRRIPSPQLYVSGKRPMQEVPECHDVFMIFVGLLQRVFVNRLVMFAAGINWRLQTVCHVHLAFRYRAKMRNNSWVIDVMPINKNMWMYTRHFCLGYILSFPKYDIKWYAGIIYHKSTHMRNICLTKFGKWWSNW